MKKHLAIVISYAGREFLINNIIHCLKENHTPILLISSTENVDLKRYVDYHL